MSPRYVVCADTGSTFTKAAAVVVDGPDAGRLLATTAVPTTVGPGLDVLTGLDDAVARVVADAHGSAELRIIGGGGHELRHDPRAVAVLLGWLSREHNATVAVD